MILLELHTKVVNFNPGVWGLGVEQAYTFFLFPIDTLLIYLHMTSSRTCLRMETVLLNLSKKKLNQKDAFLGPSNQLQNLTLLDLTSDLNLTLT